MICGFVMAKKGEKISKSKNNATSSPSDLIEKYSADSIRYWAANSKLGTDTMFSEEELLTSNRFLTKLWNAAKFSLMHLEDYKGEEPIKLLPADKWILERLKQTESASRKYLNEYEIGSARHEIDDFFWKDFCDNYLEIVKDRLYKPEIHGEENRRSAQFALYKSLLGILKLYAPYVPHITEEIYQSCFVRFEGSISIHTLMWGKEEKFNEEILSFGSKLVEIVSEARKYKSERNLSLKEPLKKIELSISGKEEEFFKDTMKDLMACTSAGEILIKYGEEFSVLI
jgi:valyl-tRNA synthetase